MIDFASLVFVLAAFAGQPPPPPEPAQTLAPSAAPTLAPSAAPSARPSPAAPTQAPPPEAPSGAPNPVLSAEPAPAPPATPMPPTPAPEAYKYRFVPRQPDQPAPGVPQIFAIYLNDRTLRSGQPILIKVVTSPDVVRVVSRSNGREGALGHFGPGDFEANSRLPKIPFIAVGVTTQLEFIAFTAEGKSVSVKFPVKLG